jgi:preprotein translocase subunit SecF
MKRLLLLPLLLLISAAAGFAQDKSEMTIEEQINHLLLKSNRWEDFKVIKINSLEQLRADIADSLQTARKEVAEAKEATAGFEAEKAALVEQINKRDVQIMELSKEKESIGFMGIFIEKTLYKNIMWGLSGGLSVLLLIFMFRFKRSNVVTVQVKSALAEIQEEYHSYKKRALEKEQKLARELQNELNKRMA